jgi:hypothetical protein
MAFIFLQKQMKEHGLCQNLGIKHHILNINVYFFMFPFYSIFIIDTTIMLLIFPNIIINIKKKKKELIKKIYLLLYL